MECPHHPSDLHPTAHGGSSEWIPDPAPDHSADGTAPWPASLGRYRHSQSDDRPDPSTTAPLDQCDIAASGCVVPMTGEFAWAERPDRQRLYFLAKPAASRHHCHAVRATDGSTGTDLAQSIRPI